MNPFKDPPRRRFSPSTSFRGTARIPVRPWIPCPDDDAPPSATPFVADGHCDACPALARVVFAGVFLSAPDGWTVHDVSVRELHLCGHHADRMEPLLEQAGWVAVADTRSRIAG